MWKAAAGHNVQVGNADDDDWETDPDFVVRILKLLIGIRRFVGPIDVGHSQCTLS